MALAAGSNEDEGIHSFCELDEQEFALDFMKTLAEKGIAEAYNLLGALSGAPGGGLLLAKYLPDKKAPSERVEMLPCCAAQDSLLLGVFRMSYSFLRSGFLGAVAHLTSNGAAEQLMASLACISSLQLSRPVRSRLGDDVGFLDAVANFAAQTVMGFGNLDIQAVTIPLKVLAMTLGQRWRPYAAHVKQLRETADKVNAIKKSANKNKIMPPLDGLVASITSILATAKPEAKVLDLFKPDSERTMVSLADQFDWVVAGYFAILVAFTCSIEEDPAAWSPQLFNFVRNYYNQPDSCDFCGKTSGGKGDMKHCAKCRYTRYCSVDCQRQHWKVGHKHNCFDAQVGKDEHAADCDCWRIGPKTVEWRSLS